MPEAKTDSQKLDAISEHLDSLHKRMDSEAEERKADRARLDATCARMDAADKARADAEEKEKEEAKAKADAAKKDEEAAAAKAKADAEAKEKEEKERADAAARAATPDVQAQLKALERMLPAQLSAEDRVLFATAQAKADRVAHAYGDSAGAPHALNGETLNEYRRRLLGRFKAHSSAWKDIDLTPFADKALDPVEAQIYADAMTAVMSPDSVAAGTLREHITLDDTGRKIKSYTGDPEACWGQFKSQPRVMVGYDLHKDRH